MARGDNRWVDPAGNKIEFSCGNDRFWTNINKGYPHGVSSTRGSALKDPVVSPSENDGYSLWLEHVVEAKGEGELYWLMWYDENGKPTISMSAIFNKEELAGMVKQLVSFVP